MLNIHKKDIIKVIEETYINYPGGAYKDHFVKKAVLYLVETEPTNNGNFTAVTTKGISKFFNAITNDNIIKVYNR